MSGKRLFFVLLFSFGVTPFAALAQDDAVQSVGPPSQDDDCRRRQEAAEISGEIVVCANRERNDAYRLRDPKSSSAYADATRDKGNARAPDMNGPPCVPSLLTACVKSNRTYEGAREIDLSALPVAPPGSDATKVGPHG
ncbi:MAG: hypothetical protein ABGW87_00985 [Sphingomonadaceae bacterium]